jgi:spectinomycin phosphotransferase
MYDAPDIAPATIAAALDRAYGIVATVTFLPVGADSSAWAYRADARDGSAYFVKLRRLPVDPAVALVPRALRDCGVPGVLAPLPTLDGAPHATADEYGVVVYPFVTGRTGMQQPLTAEQWVTFGQTARRIHDAALDPSVRHTVPRETFRPKWAGVVRDWGDAREVGERVMATDPVDEIAAAAAAFWREQRELIDTVVDRAAELAAAARAAARERVVCQADLHTGNVLVDEHGELLVVDWDEVVVAPRERDLMFVVGGGISRDLVPPEAEQAFVAGYGAADVDAGVLAYYKHAWAVQDVAEYATQAFARRDIGAAGRRAALETLRGLFAEGEIVRLALACPA